MVILIISEYIIIEVKKKVNMEVHQI